MKVTKKDTYALADKREKVLSVPRVEVLKMIYGWVKHGDIDFGSFSTLLDAIEFAEGGPGSEDHRDAEEN